MRIVLLLAVLLLLACGTPNPFEYGVRNVGVETIYLETSWSSLEPVQVQRGTEGYWQDVQEGSDSSFCTRRCSNPGRVMACPAIAWMPQVFAVMGGEEWTAQHSGEGWVINQLRFGGCSQRVDLEGLMRLRTCWSYEAQEDDGATTVMATETGLVEGDGWGAVLVNPICVEEEFSLPEDVLVVREIGAL